MTLTNAYLRELFKPTARTFTMYVEPLVGNRINFRNNGNQYAIVIGTGPQIPVADIQHAYLHFMLDTLPLRYRKETERKSALLAIAARAPQLPVQYRQDFLGFADECLIKAVELRLRKPAAAQRSGARSRRPIRLHPRPTFRGATAKVRKRCARDDLLFPRSHRRD